MVSSFKNMSKFELVLWISSVVVIVMSDVFIGKDVITAAASVIGVTALIFLAKGDVLGQILTIAFSLFYGYISFRFRYWGEMITYLAMTAPTAAAAVVTWIKNPYAKHEVKISPMSKTKTAAVILLTAAVTALFYFLLRALDTPNIVFSTISIATSFSAALLMVFRSPFYAVCYAANDIVLIVLWVLAAMTDISYFAMIVCFLIFFVNDIYGFVNWKHMAKKQFSAEYNGMNKK